MKIYWQENWFSLPNNFIDSGLAKDLGPAAYILYTFLCRYIDRGGKCFPSYRHIVKYAPISKASIKPAIEKLGKLGLVKYKKGKSFQEANEYSICLSNNWSSLYRNKLTTSKNKEPVTQSYSYWINPGTGTGSNQGPQKDQYKNNYSNTSGKKWKCEYGYWHVPGEQCAHGELNRIRRSSKYLKNESPAKASKK